MSDVLVFVAVAAAVAGQGLDVITTNAGLASGGKETNGIVSLFISKIGFPAVAFIKVAGLGMGLPILSYSLDYPGTAAVVGFIMAGGGFAAGLINYFRLKKVGVKVF